MKSRERITAVMKTAAGCRRFAIMSDSLGSGLKGAQNRAEGCLFPRMTLGRISAVGDTND
jgi:hypothetical protein